jgi:hypothetical protein
VRPEGLDQLKKIQRPQIREVHIDFISSNLGAYRIFCRYVVNESYRNGLT